MITSATSRLLDSSLSGTGETEESSRSNTDERGVSHQESPDRTPSSASLDTFRREFITV